MTDDSLSPPTTRRQLRETERHQHTPTRRDIRNAVEASLQEKSRQARLPLPPELTPELPSSAGEYPVAAAVPDPASLSARPSVQAPFQPSLSPPVQQSPAVSTTTLRTVPDVLSPIRPQITSTPRTVTMPVTKVVEHDTSLDVDSAPTHPTRRVRPAATTHTFPVSMAPRADRARPVEHKTAGQRFLTWAVMVSAPLLFIGVSMPVNLFYTPDGIAPAIALDNGDADGDVAGQAFIVDSSPTEITTISRESWSVTSYAEVLRSRYGGRSYNYSVGQGGAIRWPFPVAVPISSGFGTRTAPCRYCSSYHRGIDFVPGSGAPTYAMAEGRVTQSEFSGGYGQHVYIEHRVNGQSVLTVYAHLQRDSSPLRVGDEVGVGDFVGLVGSTGTSTGAHLHFEVRVDGVYVDPFAYLSANAG